MADPGLQKGYAEIICWDYNLAVEDDTFYEVWLRDDNTYNFRFAHRILSMNVIVKFDPAEM